MTVDEHDAALRSMGFLYGPACEGRQDGRAVLFYIHPPTGKQVQITPADTLSCEQRVVQIAVVKRRIS